MKNKLIVGFLGCLFLFTACSDFLEPKSKSEFVPKEATALNELLLGEAYPRSGQGRLNVFLGFLDDDIDSAPYQELSVGQHRDAWYAAFTWQPDLYERFEDDGYSASVYNIYEGHYARILGTNAVLDYIGDMTGTEEEINIVTAQALALRAFYYLNLVNIFAAPYYADQNAPGVPLKLISDFEDKHLPRNTVGEVYNQIVGDLLEAERLYLTLPERLQWQMDYRASLPMVRLLLSRVYLYMEEWESSAKYALKVINEGGFRLWDLNEVVDTTSLGRARYESYHTFDSPEVIWCYGDVSDVVGWISALGKEDNRYQNHPVFKASDDLLATFDASTGDLRKTRYTVYERYASFQDGVGSYYLTQPFGKMLISSNYRPSTNSFARSFRVAEAYLNYCEASAMIYKTEGKGESRTSALQYLNTLRKYRVDKELYTQLDISDADQLVKYIRDERRRELCFEDHRWFDLKRQGMPEIKHVWNPVDGESFVFTLQKNDPSYTLPIPQESLDLNKELKQNELAPDRNGETI